MNKLIRITTVPVSLSILLKSHLKFMADYYEVVAVSSKGEQLDKIAQEFNIRAIGIDMTRKITPLADLRALYKLYIALKNEKPLIVHTHTPKAGLLGMIAAKMADVPVRLHTVAGMPLLETRGLKKWVLELTEKLTYLCATKIYPNSKVMKDIIISKRYCPPNKLTVIGNGSSSGIDTNYFNPDLFTDHDKHLKRTELGINSTDFVYCFIGRIVSAKGINELVTAFCSVHKLKKETRLLLVGAFENDLDPVDAATEKQIQEHPAITWINFQNDVRPYMAISNVFVFPSHREGFPNVVMQAGAMGLACIVTDINGCNEIVDDHKNGLIVPPKDIKALRLAMEKLANNIELLKRMRSLSRQLIISRYAQQFVLSEMLKEYQDIERNHATSAYAVQA